MNTWQPGAGLIANFPYFNVSFGPGVNQCVQGSLIPGPYPIDTTGGTAGQPLVMNAGGTKFVAGGTLAGLTFGYSTFAVWIAQDGVTPVALMSLGGDVANVFSIGNNSAPSAGTRIKGPHVTVQNDLIVGTTNSINAAAQFEVDSTTKGVLDPCMTTTQKNAIPSPPDGLRVYDITLHKYCHWDASGSTWRTITST